MHGPGILVPLMAIVGFFASIIIWIYMHYSSRYKERMALLEYGKDTGTFDIDKSERGKTLKYGIVGVMAGLGLFIASVLDHTLGMGADSVYVALTLLFGGAGLIGYYYIRSPKDMDSGVL
jgi:hypothetical protein